MASEFQLTLDPNTVIRAADGTHVPVGQPTNDSVWYAQWLAAGNVPDPVSAVSVAQQDYAATLNAGVVITCASTPAINGTYSISDSAISNIQAQQISILTKNQFTNGQTARPWIDASGTIHIFPNTALFTEFAVAIGQYVDALTMALATAEAGGGWAPPAQPAELP
jgi:hypothetical protein